MGNRRFIKKLQELRGLAAILIVVSHIPFFESLIGTSLGGYGVAVFFLLSGFLIMHSTENNVDRFLIKRGIRIIPLYYVMTLFTFGVARIKPGWFNTTVASIPNLIKSLLFIPYVNPNGVVRPILDVTWALFPEVWLTFVFYVSLKISVKYRGLITGSFFLLLLFSGYFWNNAIFRQYRISFICLPLGMLIYYIWKTLNTKRERINIRLKQNNMNGILFLLFWGIGIAYNYLTINGLNSLGILLTSIVFCCFLFAEGQTESVKWFLLLGDISYSIYLIHEFVVKGFSRIVYSLENVNWISFSLSAFCILMTILAAYFVNTFIEKPCLNYLRKSFKV